MTVVLDGAHNANSLERRFAEARHEISVARSSGVFDAFVTNDPAGGGSHLPDVTVVTPVHDDAGATTFATDVNSRVRRVPEIVDFRVQGNDKYKWFWKRQLLRGDAQGRTTCSKGPAAAACVSCGMRMHVLCECAFRKAYGAGNLVSHEFKPERARSCCLSSSLGESGGNFGNSSFGTSSGGGCGQARSFGGSGSGMRPE